MDLRKILIVGGAGFVGSNLAVNFKRAFADTRILAFDNLKRRGSELNLPRLREHGVEFHHGDVRCREDLRSVPEFDLLIDCCAEPSVMAGMGGSPTYVLDTNLVGTLNCLEEARLHDAAFIFLSTSRVYPIARLNAIPWEETSTRFTWGDVTDVPGFSKHGVAEEFPLGGSRSLYGASKLASELILQEYVSSYGVPAIVNRCGILTGPWQMGKVDQGVVALWVASHIFRRDLRYTGFGGQGKQVRDLLHVDDLFDLLLKQIKNLSLWDGRVYNVGGGQDVSVSLRELTKLCEEVSGQEIDIQPSLDTSDVDLRIYLSDSRKVGEDFSWRPTRDASRIVEDIHQWICNHRRELEGILA